MPASKVAISREHLGTRATFAIQQQSQKLANQASLLPRQGLVTVMAQVFAVGTNTVVIHGLGRPIVGWNIVRPRATGGVVPASAPSAYEVASDNQTLTLGPYAGFTADIEVW